MRPAEWIAPALLVLIGLLLASEYVLMPWTVVGASMEPGLRAGDRVLVDRWTFRARPPRLGEVALLLAPDGRHWVKRVVRRPPTAPDHGVWVVGDHAAASTDSRQLGPVPASALLGRVAWRIWPLSRFGPVR